jgi:predicted ATPase with chaperone activity
LLVSEGGLVNQASHGVEDVEHTAPEDLPISSTITDYQYIKGQELVKWAMEVVSAGGQNLIMLWTTDSSIFSHFG